MTARRSTDSDVFAALRLPHVGAYVLGRTFSAIATMIVLTNVSWQLYEQTGDAWALGTMGLCHLVPAVALAIPAGHLADRFPRRDVAMAMHGVLAAVAAALALFSWMGAPVVWIYALLFVSGAARTLSNTSTSAILPQLLPPEQLASTNGWVAASLQVSMALGPLIAGGLIPLGKGVAVSYGAAVLSHFLMLLCFRRLPVVTTHAQAASTPRDARQLLIGFDFIRQSPALRAVLILEILSVLLGDCVALLPMFAKDILLLGPVGLGWLRSTWGAGSLAVALLTTRLSPWQHPGRVLLLSYLGFAIATIGFGFSRSVALSLACLFLIGACGQTALLVRVTLAQMMTPDALRGRVYSVQLLSSSVANELGRFESGAVAALWGPTASVVFGGLGTLGVVLITTKLAPLLRSLPPLHTVRPSTAGQPAELASRPMSSESIPRHPAAPSAPGGGDT